MAEIDQAADILQLLGEPTRIRLLALLESHELNVTELAAITQLAQPRVSTHLGRLREAGLVRDRREGTSSFYRLDDAAPSEAHARLWQSLRDVLGDAELEADRRRAEEVIAHRAAGAWPELVAGEMERHYSPGRTWEATARAFAGLAALGDVLDVGSGDGVVAGLLAPHARSVCCLDASPRVAAAARRRLASFESVRYCVADMQALPFPAERFDQVLMLNVLTYAADPRRALRESARALRPGGQLCVVTVDAHEHGEVARSYGHVHDGFSPSALKGLLRKARLDVASCEVTSVERRTPAFRVVTAFARKKGSA